MAYVGKGYTAEDYQRKFDELGSARAVARAFGVNQSTVSRALQRVQMRDRRAAETDDGFKAAASAAGIHDLTDVHSGWVKHEKGSFYIQLPKDQRAELDDTIERIKEAMVDVPRADPLPPPETVESDLLTVYPIADAHIGMLSWHRETGEDYDTRLASKRMVNWLARVAQSSPNSETAIILDVGDTLHSDDTTNQTPAGKHNLDSDSRHFKTVDVAIETLIQMITLALEKHQKVIVVVLKGNHDPHAYLAILQALYHHYLNEPRVEVQKKPGDFFAYEFGRCMITANHGDKAKPGSLVALMANHFAEMWGRTKYRFLFTGHLHHHKSAEIGGMIWEQLSAIAPKDYYSFSGAFLGLAQLSAITYHKEQGVKFRTFVNA